MPSVSGFPRSGLVLLLIVVALLLVSEGDDDGGDGRGGDGRGPAAEREDERRAPSKRRAGSGPSVAGASPAERPGAPLATVLRVVDGDTIAVEIDGEEESVRYIGVDTPESVAPGEPVECFGKRASRFNERLVAGLRVRLEFGAERRDHYGRLLAYVYAGGELVNAKLLRSGHARTLAIAPNTDLAGRFARLQQRAANAGRGLWSAC